MAFKDDIKKQLFDSIPKNFIDPITSLPPKTETQLSSLLCLFHLSNRVKWEQIDLYTPNNNHADKTADSIITDMVYCEYPLFAKTDSQIDIWGQMSADLLFYSISKSMVTLIENKIGSNFTSGGDDIDTGQLARQIEYLIQSQIKKRNIVILSSKHFFDKQWYSSELFNTLFHKKRSDLVSGYLVYWEDVFAAID